MSISGINSYQSSALASGGANASSPQNAYDTAAQNFMDLMKQSPMERWVDQWLKAHHLTKEDLEKMSPEKRQAIMKQMAADIGNDIKQKAAEGKKGLMADVFA